jgi:hypothetical protein
VTAAGGGPPRGDEARVAAARDAVAADAAVLAGIVRELWDVAPDPLGQLLLLPRAGAGAPQGDPLPLESLPWAPVLERFRERHGQPPAPGARAVAARALRGRAGPG